MSSSSSEPRPPRSCGDGVGEGGNKEDAVSKAAGFVVFSGIAMNIIRALSPKPQQQPPPPPPPPLPLHEPAVKQEPSVREEACGSVPPTTRQTIEIVQGDTLWGLSRKYRVPINEIKKANGLTGDTIYAGKKLVIP